MSSPPAAAGRLSHHVEAWAAITDNPFVLKTVSAGYRLEFCAKPPIMPPREAAMQRTLLSGRRAAFMDREVKALLDKGAIQRCAKTPGFFSRMFLVPKKNGDLRPIINLKPLNAFVHAPHFSMHTVKDVFRIIQSGDWAVCLDLKDAYFHVSVHARFRRFLQFIWRGVTYQYTALPFGLASSPRVFTRITKPVSQYLRSRGVRVLFYLDDILVLSPSRQAAEADSRTVINLLQSLGFSLNAEKSVLSPAQRFVYLGLAWDTLPLSVSLPGDKAVEIKRLASGALSRPHLSARALLSLLGKLTFAAYAVPLARLHVRELQSDLRAVYRRPSDLSRRVPLRTGARRELRFWAKLDCTRRPLRRQQPDLIMATDASGSGWGACLQSATASGVWSREEKRRHINYREMLAVWRAVQAFRTRLRGSTLSVQIDNRTAVAYLSKEGGTRSVSLSRLACRILLWCHRRGVDLLPVYVRGSANTVADSLSRSKETEWHLSPLIAQRIFRLFGTPAVDLFASARTAQLPLYMTLDRADSRAVAVDALSQEWPFPLVFAFPPPTLVPAVLNKLKTTSVKMLLIAPAWSDAPWLPVVIGMLCGSPRRLPLLEDLVMNVATGFPVRDLGALRLTVWPLCGDLHEASACARIPFALSNSVGEVPQSDNTRRLGESGVHGVPTSIWTRLPFL